MLFLRQQVNKIYKPLFLKECLPRNAVNTLVFYSPFSVCEKGLCLYTNSQEVNLMPSAKILADKQARVAEITEMLKNATSGVIVDYKGISVEADTKLRKDLREAGVNYFVVKNSILRFAVKEAGLEELADVLTGSTAIAVSEDDAIAPARILVKAAEELPEGIFSVKSGFMEGSVISVDEINKYAKLPSKDVLIAQVCGALKSPLSMLAICLKQVAEKEEQSA